MQTFFALAGHNPPNLSFPSSRITGMSHWCLAEKMLFDFFFNRVHKALAMMVT
jgi:hypothetical protein